MINLYEEDKRSRYERLKLNSFFHTNDFSPSFPKKKGSVETETSERTIKIIRCAEQEERIRKTNKYRINCKFS